MIVYIRRPAKATDEGMELEELGRQKRGRNAVFAINLHGLRCETMLSRKRNGLKN